jgi:HAE1 family hydrophobic/amphiphilic exporter-1
MGLTSLAIRRPLFMLMVISAIVVFGLVSYSRLGVDLNPNVNFPVVSIVTSYPGAGSESVDRLVTRKIEDAVAGINGIDYIRSSSTRGVSQVVVVFKDGVNADTASIEVERKVNAARASLPTEAEAPTIVKADLQAQPVIDLAL